MDVSSQSSRGVVRLLPHDRNTWTTLPGMIVLMITVSVITIVVMIVNMIVIPTT